MIITFGSLKGGVGKTTLTVNAAVELTRLGRSVFVVDADDIGSAAKWINDREEYSPDAPPIFGAVRYGSLRNALHEFAKHYDDVLVDVGGFDSTELRSAALASDLLIVPMQTSSLDIDTMPRFVKLLTDLKDLNPDLSARALLTMASTHPQDRDLDDSRKRLATWSGLLPVLDSALHHRTAYRKVMPLGRGVVEWKDSKAKAETQVLVQEMMSL